MQSGIRSGGYRISIKFSLHLLEWDSTSTAIYAPGHNRMIMLGGLEKLNKMRKYTKQFLYVLCRDQSGLAVLRLMTTKRMGFAACAVCSSIFLTI